MEPQWFHWLVLLLLIATPLLSQSIFTYAGGGSVEGRPATLVPIRSPNDVAVDSSGNLFIADRDSHRILRVDGATGVLTTFAGTGASGFGGDGGLATAATFNEPSAVALDRAGNLIIADGRNGRLRRVDAITRMVTTIASGLTLSNVFVQGLAVDSAGNIFITDLYGVQKISAASGLISRVAGGVFNTGGDGGPATAAKLDFVASVAVDGFGHIYISQWGPTETIRKVDGNTGIISTFAGVGSRGFSGDGGPATAALLAEPMDLAIDSAGNLLFGDAGNFCIRKIDLATGVITTVAGTPGSFSSGGVGDGGPANRAKFWELRGLVADSARNIYVADNADRRVRKISAASVATTAAGNGQANAGLTGDGGPAIAAVLNLSEPFIIDGNVAVDSTGNVYVVDGNHSVVRRVSAASGSIVRVAGTGSGGGVSGDGRPATQNAISIPEHITVDQAGNFYFRGFNVEKVDVNTGLMRKVAGGGTGGDGSPATQARVSPSGLAIDDGGNLYIAERGGNRPYSSTSRIRKVDAATGIITTVAGGGSTFTGDGVPATSASLCEPIGVAVDSARNIFIVDCWGVQKVDSTNTIRRVAGKPGGIGFSGDGGPATAALLSAPGGLAVDREGNIYVADTGNLRVRRIDARTGAINTVAGAGGVPAYAGDGGPATGARLANPNAVAISRDGDLFIGDANSNRIRVVYACITVVAPTLLSPSNNSSGLTVFPKLSWRAVKGAFRYDVLLDTVNPPRTVAASNITPPSFSPANLDALTTYYWQVIAKGDPYCTPPSSAASEVRAFTTAAECGPPPPP